MTEGVVNTLLTSWGPFGGLLVVAGAFIWKLHTQLTLTQEARTRDAQQFVITVLGLVEKQREQAEATVNALHETSSALREVRQTLLDDHRHDLRRR